MNTKKQEIDNILKNENIPNILFHGIYNHGKEELCKYFLQTLYPKSDDFQKYVMDSNILYNHQPTIHKKFVKETIALVPEGGNYKDLPKGMGESRKFNEAWTRYHSKKPSRTIDTGHRNHFHYKWNRVPTIRENARLQSFKDSFIKDITVHGKSRKQRTIYIYISIYMYT